jgi:hypothetical protein
MSYNGWTVLVLVIVSVAVRVGEFFISGAGYKALENLFELFKPLSMVGTTLLMC